MRKQYFVDVTDECPVCGGDGCVAPLENDWGGMLHWPFEKTRCANCGGTGRVWTRVSLDDALRDLGCLSSTTHNKD